MALRAKSGRISTIPGSGNVRSATISAQLILTSITPRPLLAQTPRSVSSRRDAPDAAEHRREVTRGPESHQPRDLRDGDLRRRQECAGAGDAPPHHEPVGRQTRAALEEAREMVGAHVHEGGQLAEPQLFVEVLLDVLGHPPNSARRETGGCGLHRRQSPFRGSRNASASLGGQINSHGANVYPTLVGIGYALLW